MFDWLIDLYHSLFGNPALDEYELVEEAFFNGEVDYSYLEHAADELGLQTHFLQNAGDYSDSDSDGWQEYLDSLDS